jgi:Trypsin
MNGKIAVLLFALTSSAVANFIEIEPKVVNGTDANIAEFPFMISLRRNGRHHCGATIINEYWLLTVRLFFWKKFKKFVQILNLRLHIAWEIQLRTTPRNTLILLSVKLAQM